MLLRWALRELRRSWKACTFFVLNLSLGLAGFISLEAYKTALQNHVIENRQRILGADLSAAVRREFTEEELRLLNESTADLDSTVVYDFFAMVAIPGGASRLVLVKAVDPAYPLYGDLVVDDGSRLAVTPGGIWVYPELATQLGVTKGTTLKLGELSLELRGLITEDSTQTFRSAGLAPRVFIDRSQLAASGLLQFGSTFTRAHLFRVPEAIDPEALREKIFSGIKDPAVRVETASEEAEDSSRQLNYLSDFLGLVALVGLFLAALGAAYLWRLFLVQRTKDVAILRSLGLDGDRAVLLYVIEASILGVVALIPAVIGAQIVFPLLNKLLSVLTPFELTPVLTGSSILVGLALSLGSSLLVALPFLLRLREVRPATLFSEEKFNPDLDLRRPWAFLPALGALWALAIVQSNSIRVGSLFIAVLAVVVVLLAGGGWLCLKMLNNLRKGPWDLRQGLRSASRRRAASLSVFVALGIGSLLMNVLPQIKVTLQNELTLDGTSKLPSLFMFDIQDEQLPTLKESVTARGTELSGLSPMIRARILKVNGQDYERTAGEAGFQTREEERDARFRNRGVNLSFRSELSESEDLVEGRPLSGTYDAAAEKPAELSVEQRYADRMGLKLGDRMVFDVQGVEVEGEIVNLRRVRWTSFQPNFFVLIQSGVLDDAPKTWIASVPRLPDEAKTGLQNDLAAKLGNVSVVDVGRTVNDVLKVADQMSWSLEFMAALSLVTGAVVLFSIARTQVRSRRWELNLLKVLGASPGRVRRYVLAEFAVLAGLSSLLGGLLSLLVSSVLIWQYFDAALTFDLRWVLGTSFVVTVIGVLVAERAAAAVVREKPLQIFRGE